MTEPTPIAVPPGLRGLGDHDAGVIAALRDVRVDLEQRSGLDERTIELIRLGTLIALGAPAESFTAHVRRAVAVGATTQDVWGAVMVVATLVGVPRLIAAVPAIEAALAGDGDA